MTNTVAAPDYAAQGYESFKIPVERVADLEARVEKLNKKAAKLGTPPISLIVTDVTEDHTTSVGGRIAAMRRSPIMAWTSRLVWLKGETPKIDGWEFLSVVMHRPAGNEFVNVMDTTVDLSEFIFTDKDCDHCGKKRVRNATFLVRKDDQIKQVGSSCLTDYTGVKSPQAHARQLENIFNLFRELRGGGWTQGRTTRKFFVTEWLAWVSMTMREQGRYVGRNRAYDTGEYTTAENAKRTVLAALADPNAVQPSDADYERAQAAVEWARTDEAYERITEFSPEFARQFFAATASDDETVGENVMGIIAPAIVMHERWLAEQVAPTSEWVGQEKDKLTVQVKVERSNSFEGAYGWTTVFNMRDEAGNAFVWFSSKHQAMEVGKSYILTGTVKKHDTDNYRNGEKTTVLTRCKVECEAA